MFLTNLREKLGILLLEYERVGFYAPVDETARYWTTVWDVFMKQKMLRVGMVALGVLAVSLPALYVHFRCDIWPEDDAYITYRYVQNSCNGNGLVYNVGERVFGSSSPLFTVALCGLKAVLPTVDIATLAVRFNVVPFLIASLLLTLLVQKLTRAWLPACLAGGMLLLNPFMLEVSIGGMEAFWFAAFVLAALVAGVCGHLVPAFALAGLATLTRPEGALCAATLAALLPWRHGPAWRVLVRCGAAYVVVLLLWGLPATLYYGSPIPHSLIAKSQPLYPLSGGSALREMLSLFRSWAVGDRPVSLPWLRSAGALALAVAAVSGFGVAWRKGRRGPAIALLPFALFVAFYAVSNPMIFPWYWPNLYVPGILMTAVGLCLLWKERRARLPRAIVVVCVLLVTIFPLTRWQLLSQARAQRGPDATGLGFVAPDRQAALVRILPYWILGTWLSDRYPASTVMAAPEIGALGYAFHGKILDVCGLVSPEAIPYLPVPLTERVARYTGAISTKLVLDLRPDLVVSMQLFGMKSLQLSPEFKERYKLIAECALPHPLWLSHSVEVYERVDGVVRLSIPQGVPPPAGVTALDPTL